MRWLAAFFWAGLWPWRGAAQPDLRPEVLQLARIKVKMEENLTRLPNYTCLQTIERSERRAPSKRFRLIDTLRLEVALVEGKELFSWPGAGRFEDREIREFVFGGGAIGNGNFALHARSVFLSNAPTFAFGGEMTQDGRKILVYDYRVPQLKSGYRLRVGEQEAIVGYHGSFWVDAETLDLIRLEVHADNIPPHLSLSSASDVIEYGRVRIGESEFLLPRASELTMVDLAGNENRNWTSFTSCHQYAGESVISFGEPPPSEPAPAAKTVTEIELPADLDLELQLKTPIDSGSTAVGDPVSAVLLRDAKYKGQVVVPKGASVSGRVVHLEKRITRWEIYLVGLQLTAVEFDHRRANLTASLREVGPFFGAGARLSSGYPYIYVVAGGPEAPSAILRTPGVGVFAVRSSPLRLGGGLRMIWRTLQAPPEVNK